MILLYLKCKAGFLSGRFIGENARLIYDILHATEEKQIPGLLMLIDFEKAFDCVSWGFLYAVLNLFNFGINFVRWITVFNTNIKAYVIQSSFLSDPINAGVPLEPTL